MTPTASVIMTNLHSSQLGDVIEALRRQTIRPLEVIVVGQDRYGLAHDDGWVRVVATPRPTPPAVARNVGLAYARGEICCFLDSDCVPVENWLALLLDHQARGQLVVGGSIGFQPQTYWQLCDNIACLGAFMATASPGQRPYLLSGNVAIHRTVLRHTGGFDPRFRQAAGEDAELGLRIRSKGYTIQFEPRAVVYHHTNRNDARSVWYHMRTFGTQWSLVAQRHGALLGGSLWQRLYDLAPPLGVAAAPAAALRDVYQFYGAQPALLRRYWSTLPGVFWARLGWYAGLMRPTPLGQS